MWRTRRLQLGSGGWGTLLAALGLAVSAAASPPPAVSLRYPPERRCPSEGELRRALVERLGPGRVLPKGAGSAAAVQLTPRGEQELLLTVSHGQAQLQRVLPAGAVDCAAVPQTVALLVEAWLGQEQLRVEQEPPQATRRPALEPRAPTELTSPSRAGQAARRDAAALSAEAGARSASAVRVEASDERAHGSRAASASAGVTARPGASASAAVTAPRGSSASAAVTALPTDRAARSVDGSPGSRSPQTQPIPDVAALTERSAPVSAEAVRARAAAPSSDVRVAPAPTTPSEGALHAPDARAVAEGRATSAGRAAERSAPTEPSAQAAPVSAGLLPPAGTGADAAAARGRGAELFLLGGAALPGGEALVVGALAARLELPLSSRLSAGVELGFDASRQLDAGPGVLELDAQAAALVARASLWPTQRSGPSALVGLRLERLVATARGFSQPGEQVLWSPGAYLGAAWQQLLGGRWSLMGFAGLRVRTRREAFGVENVEEVLTLPLAEGQLGGGFGVRFF